MQIKCSNAECSQTLKIPDAAAGKAVRCPACGTITVADAPIEGDPGGIDFESLAGLEGGKPVDTPPAVPGAPPEAPTSPSAETVPTPMPDWVRDSTRPQTPDASHTGSPARCGVSSSSARRWERQKPSSSAALGSPETPTDLTATWPGR